ncbi:MAG: hypothetical protein Q7S15_02345, partial [bacterium]|nr:hypothetical protein [bacterium]
MIIDIVKVFLPSTIAFFLGIALTPLLTYYLYKYKMWKKRPGKMSPDGHDTPIFNELHKEREVGTPKMGGVIIWLSTLITVTGIWAVAKLFPGEITSKLDLLSRNQTWIPLATLILGSLIGLVDDFMDVAGSASHVGRGLSLYKRIAIVALIGLLAALWFYFKLDVTGIGIPFSGELYLGWLFVPFFVLVTLAIYSGGVIDGIDGLAGGLFATMFAAYAGIAFYQQQINLAAFSSVVTGAILAFLWF